MSFTDYAILVCCLLCASIRLSAVERLIRRLKGRIFRGWTAVVVCGVTAFAVNAIACWDEYPAAEVHDEFSYLLAADTFSKGRITNPTHSLRMHFESIHINHQPTYASMYPPGQGVLLALGILLAGHPAIGVWLGFGFAAALTCWMLQAWLPNRWAFVGGLLLACHSCLLFGWGQSYWGGQVALIGGALLCGAYARLKQSAKRRYAILVAVGLVILANTRPFEGLMMSIPIAIYLLSWLLVQKRNELASMFVRVVLPIGVVLSLAAAAMCYYNARVTGNALQMPSMLNNSQYSVSPVFIWQTLNEEPNYQHDSMKSFYTGWSTEGYLAQQSLSGWFFKKLEETKRCSRFYFNNWSPTFLLPLLCWPWMLAAPRCRFALVVLTTTFVATLQICWLQPHYWAPVAPLFFLLIVQGLRRLRLIRIRRVRIGRMLVRFLLLLHVVMFVDWFPHAPDVAYWYKRSERANVFPWHRYRAELIDRFSQGATRQLILVRYSSAHDVLNEWVYNEADIDAAKVVWAREMGLEKNRELLDYFHDRKAWLILADERPPRILPFEERPFGDEESRLDELLSQKPDDAQNLLKLGKIEQSTGRRIAALPRFQKAVKFAPDLAEARLSLGNVLCQLDRWEQGISEIKRALVLDPKNAEGHLVLGYDSERRGDYQTALRYYRKVLELNPNDAFARQKVQSLIHMPNDQ